MKLVGGSGDMLFRKNFRNFGLPWARNPSIEASVSTNFLCQPFPEKQIILIAIGGILTVGVDD